MKVYKYKYKKKTRVGIDMSGMSGMSSPVARPRVSIVYYIRITFKDGLTLYKIGYTSMPLAKRVEGYYSKRLGYRTTGMGLPCGSTWKHIATLYKGSKANAYEWEQDLHRRWANVRWTGPDRLRNGNTELYRGDILGLDASAKRII